MYISLHSLESNNLTSGIDVKPIVFRGTKCMENTRNQVIVIASSSLSLSFFHFLTIDLKLKNEIDRKSFNWKQLFGLGNMFSMLYCNSIYHTLGAVALLFNLDFYYPITSYKFQVSSLMS